MSKFKLSLGIEKWGILPVMIATASVYSFISVAKHYHFQTFAWDLSFFDELIWKFSQGIEPTSSLVPLHVLGDHFQPIILLFSFPYLIWNDVRVLLVGQAMIASISVYPVYLLARRVLKKSYIALAISVAFL